MSPRGVSFLALCCALGLGGVALSLLPRSAPAAQKPRASTASAVSTRPAPSAAPSSAPRPQSAFARLPPLHIENQTTRESRVLRLYDTDGHVDPAAAAQLDQLLCDARDPKHHETTELNQRTLQLLFKAAYHFASYEVQVVSGYRKPGRHREGLHGTGDAIDFRLSGVKARELAAYLRKIPRTGVGVYTNPKTQFVHLDSREHSFHWLDASPPRRHWREKSIGERDLAARDASYDPADDLPESVTAASGGKATVAAAR